MLRSLAIALSVVLPSTVSACLTPSINTAPVEAVGIELHRPMRLLVAAGGDATLPCAGSPAASDTDELVHLSPEPAAIFDLSGMAPHILAVRAFSDCPVRLIVHTATGNWVFGRAPRTEPATGHGQELYIWSPGDGVLRVWVATEEPEQCPGEVELETYDH